MEAVERKAGGYVCFSNVHTVVEAHNDDALRSATNQALVAAPDGKPLSVFARWRGAKNIEQVAGPDFFPYLIEKNPNLRHFFMGSTEVTLAKLECNLRARFPNIDIAGSYSPPFGPMVDETNDVIIEKIKVANPDVVWVGLGAPKQEIWMAQNAQLLAPCILLGVGAAFDFHAGTTKRAPQWVRQCGLEWFHRLLSEPRRLWKRYLVTNLKFIFYISRQIIFQKLGRQK
ncbi:MAG: WecB/TagA/CpsF family glycosyltransferase [Desulfobacterales bacterium]|nr:WecB/TagA/CpsF family glycosyltransferase [Desulfobacterales bacterium]